MKNIIIGTAGHIDHGKTTLIKALTGTDTDRLPEEKARGMTIDIGFAFLDLSSDIRVNFIDVPGHERFIKNMLVGATGIDAALLVVAADDGIMPQTHEHLEILDLLKIKELLITITKCDLMEKDWIKIVKEDIQNLLMGTRFENSSIVPVSSSTGKGIIELKEELLALASRIKDRNITGVFRLPIDRVFTISGLGCVVTGSVKGGEINVNDEVELLPAKTIVRIRGIEVNGVKTNSARPGQRAALNLAGIKTAEVHRGCELSAPGYLNPVSIIDTTLYLHRNTKKPLENRTRIRFHIYTNEIIGRVTLLDKEILKPGETCLAQFSLEWPIIAERGDRYIIRSYSPACTLGGGMILRPYTHRIKRLKKDLLIPLEILKRGNIYEIVELAFTGSMSYSLSIKDLHRLTNLSEAVVEEVVNKFVNDKLLYVIGESSNAKWIHHKRITTLKKGMERVLKGFHRENILKTGIDEVALRTKIDDKLPGDVFSFLISKAIDDKMINRVGNKIALAGFSIKITDVDMQILKSVEETLLKQGFCPSPVNDLISIIDVERNHIEQLFNHLIETGTIIEIDKDLYYHRNIINKLKELISDYIKKNSAINIAEFKDLTNASRKYAIPLLEYLDKIHFTKRIGDKRILE